MNEDENIVVENAPNLSYSEPYSMIFLSVFFIILNLSFLDLGYMKYERTFYMGESFYLYFSCVVAV